MVLYKAITVSVILYSFSFQIISKMEFPFFATATESIFSVSYLI